MQQRGRTLESWLNGGQLEGRDVSELVWKRNGGREKIEGQVRDAPLLAVTVAVLLSLHGQVGQVSTYSIGRSPGWLDQAPFAEGWRILLPGQLEVVQHRLMLFLDSVFLSEGG